MSIWKVTHEQTRPAQLCSYVNDISDDAVNDLIKKVLKRAKREQISVNAITVQIEDTTASVTLLGNEGGVYRS
jgi:hypothetical protein